MSLNTKNFESLGLSLPLTRALGELGFKEPTPIQAEAIPLLLEGRDLIGQSKTGSGKTAAFTLPLLQKINPAQKFIQALILSPTRELGSQVAREIRKFGRHLPGLHVLLLAGGQPLRLQLKALAQSPAVVVGTPGRLLDLLGRDRLDLSETATVILDEADRMLDMGFRDDMEKILKALPAQRQTLFFSATFPSSIEAMSRAYQNNPARITIAGEEKRTDIQQIFYEGQNHEKFDALIEILRLYQPSSALIFCNLKTTVATLTKFLLKSNLSAACLHGDMEQPERDRVMAKFKNRSLGILVATDVAARGLDVEDLDLVCNFDLPPNPDVYTHRIGRTGRAGKKGLAISLINQRERGRIKTIEEHLETKLQEGNLGEEKPIKTQAPAINMETLVVYGGRKDKVRPGDILGALTGEAGGLEGSQVGKIEIHDRLTYVAVDKKIASHALQGLRNGKIKGRKFKVELT